ncbi:MAG: cation:proton antiporter [Opitutaceae bacterium]|jgi:CPA2 family monovalent cation:H+ antiporter-2|nr:cation:proton antiporter [Opitutaceae bacterium]
MDSEGVTLIKDLGTLLVAAGLAGIICKRLGLSVIVGYLVAGIVIGPHSPPFSLIAEEERIKALSEMGLVFVMFAIGLELSVSRLAKMGVATLAATALGAFFMLNFTLLLGYALSWSTMQSLFVAAMFMVSSSAVISKIMGELKLKHDSTAQMALAVTVVEDVVAVLMITALGAQTHASSGNGVGVVLAMLGAFVALLLVAGLLLMPRLLRRLEAKGDPELQTIMVVGLLLVLAFFTVKAGYSLTLGAFLFGAVVAEIKQKIAVEKNFAGIRYMFSSVFFVSIGMIIDMKMLEAVWLQVLLLGSFSLLVRPIACGFALMLVGVPPRQARRGGLLLTPLGEFTFIIAQAGITAAVLPVEFYPLAVGLSILTVMATPILNRYAGPILRFVDWIEPRPVKRAIDVYHGWLQQLQSRPSPAPVWAHVRGPVCRVAIEMLFISGMLIFSERILEALEVSVVGTWLSKEAMDWAFWSVLAAIVLVPTVAVWRNVSAMALILSEHLGGAGSRVPAGVIRAGLRAIALLGLAYWFYAILPVQSLPGWGWGIMAAGTLFVIVFFSNKLIYWHSRWESSLQEVLAEDSRELSEVRADARAAMGRNLETWQLQLEECVVPDGARYAGRSLTELAIPARFGCSILEIERNERVVAVTGAEVRLFPGDKLLLIGREAQLAAATEFLGGGGGAAGVGAAGRGGGAGEARAADDEGDEFGGTVLETFALPEHSPRTGRTLAELQVARRTGVRIAGIQRDGARIINPAGSEMLQPGDGLLLVGSLVELRAFRQWALGEDGGVGRAAGTGADAAPPPASASASD